MCILGTNYWITIHKKMQMLTIETYIVDSFTDTTFKGNPAGVCILDKELEVAQMQSIAKELGLSETAFVRVTETENAFSIRYFSPVMEIPLCGHATLASAKVLFDKFHELNAIEFATIQEIKLKIARKGENIAMEFPVYGTVPQEAPLELLQALGLESIVNSEYNEETRILLIEIGECDILRILSPDFETLKKSHKAINGVLVTARSNQDEYDFESRYFWPWSGTNEDPVTGGTHTFLTPYWSNRLAKSKMRSFQCSERSGFMEVELLSDTKLIIKSKAQLVLRGQLFI